MGLVRKLVSDFADVSIYMSCAGLAELVLAEAAGLNGEASDARRASGLVAECAGHHWCDVSVLLLLSEGADMHPGWPHTTGVDEDEEHGSPPQ